MKTAMALGALLLFTISASPAPAQTATARIVTAANRFLSTLDEKQRSSVQFSFNDDTPRRRWSNFPVRMVPRAGLKIGDLSPAQRTAAFALLEVALSKKGLTKVQEIMDGDELLKTNGRDNQMFGKDLFFIS